MSNKPNGAVPVLLPLPIGTYEDARALDAQRQRMSWISSEAAEAAPQTAPEAAEVIVHLASGDTDHELLARLDLLHSNIQV